MNEPKPRKRKTAKATAPSVSMPKSIDTPSMTATVEPLAAAVAALASARDPMADVDVPLDRRHRIALAAYFLAERRGFAPGHEAEDWLAAERSVDAELG